MLIRPSASTGTRQAAPPRKTPHSPARSKPPTLARTSSGSAGSGRLTSSARRTAATLRASPSSERPAPRPVKSSAGRPSSAQATAAEVVVLPMPISPVASSRTPAAACRAASRAPVRTACSAWARVMAGPAVMSPVPLPTRQSRTPGAPAKSRMPISTGTTAHRAACAIRQTGLRPAARPRATAAVAAGPVWVTPRATTPLSAQRTSTARRSKSRSALPVRAAASSSMVSSRPRLPSG